MLSAAGFSLRLCRYDQGTARVPDYLGHILKAIERTDRYTADMDKENNLQALLKTIGQRG